MLPISRRDNTNEIKQTDKTLMMDDRSTCSSQLVAAQIPSSVKPSNPFKLDWYSSGSGCGNRLMACFSARVPSSCTRFHQWTKTWLMDWLLLRWGVSSPAEEALLATARSGGREFELLQHHGRTRGQLGGWIFCCLAWLAHGGCDN